VIGSDSGEIPHVIGDAGVVAPEGDAGRWAKALGELIADPELRADLARLGLQRARTEFALDVVARRHLDFFESLIQKTASRRGAEERRAAEG